MFNAIGAHIYAGGFTAGVSKYFNVLAHLEHAAYGKDVVGLNFPGLPVHAGGPGNWPTSWPKGSVRPRFFYANPPCAIWSGASAGRATHWKDDPRLQAHHDIFNYGLGLEVDVMAIESVTAAFTKGREHVDGLIEAAAAEGYSSTIVLHDARWLGVPQIRKRVFLTFHRIEIPWQTPEPHEAPTVRQVLRGIPKKSIGYDTTMPPKLLRLAEHCGPGGRLKTAFDELYPNPETNHLGKIAGRPSFLESRAPWDKPSGVVIAGKMIHPDQPRYMNQEELAAVCSFPPSFKWPKGTFSDISGYMSRGVMPKVGEWLAENVNRALEKNRRLNQPTSNVFDATHLPSSTYPLSPVGSYEPEPSRTSVTVTLPSLSAPSIITDPVPKPRGSTVVVDWSPRICGSTAWGGHLRGGDPSIELLSFSKSGRPLGSWESAFTWEARKIADAAAILNDYDRVILADIACFAPDVQLDENERPYYEKVIAGVTRKWTAVFHGGTYPTKHDQTIDTVLSSPGFCGTLITPRIGQARSRLAAWPQLRFEHHPYLPYDMSHAPARRTAKGRTHDVLMTARLNTNKGQNAALLLSNELVGNTHIWGHSSYGLPSTAWMLWELGTLGLGHSVISPPALRADKSTMTNPDAKKFYTGKFELQSPSGRRFKYHDGYRTLDEIDWSPWVHLSLASPDFAGILEYTIIDAVLSGSVVAVPECFPTEGKYETVVTFPFNGSTIGWNDKKAVVRDTRPFDVDAVAKVVNGLLKMSDRKLSELQNAQFAEFTRLHDPGVTLAAIDRALNPKPQKERTQSVARNATTPVAASRGVGLPPPPTQGEGSGAYMRRLMTSGWNDDHVILTAVHAHFAGSKATKSDVYYNRRKLTTDAKPAAPSPTPHTGSLKAVQKAAREIIAERNDVPFALAPARPSEASDDYLYEQKLGWLFRAAGIIPGDRIKLVALARALGAGGSPSVLTVRVGGKDTTHDVKWLKTLFS